MLPSEAVQSERIPFRRRYRLAYRCDTGQSMRGIKATEWGSHLHYSAARNPRGHQISKRITRQHQKAGGIDPTCFISDCQPASLTVRL